MKHATPSTALFVILATVLLALHADAGVDSVNKSKDGEAIHGYDAVAYFTEGKPVRGDEEFTFDWMGATWLFSSAANRELFMKQPEKYAPQYGGYCAYAVGNNYTANGDPHIWSIVNEKLYLNYSKQVGIMWTQNQSEFITRGDKNWPLLLAK